MQEVIPYDRGIKLTPCPRTTGLLDGPDPAWSMRHGTVVMGTGPAAMEQTVIIVGMAVAVDMVGLATEGQPVVSIATACSPTADSHVHRGPRDLDSAAELTPLQPCTLFPVASW